MSFTSGIEANNRSNVGQDRTEADVTLNVQQFEPSSPRIGSEV
jgi:hypothetical protein